MGASAEHCLWAKTDEAAASMAELYWRVFGNTEASTTIPMDAPWWAFEIRELEQHALLDRRKRARDVAEQRALADEFTG